MSFWQLYVRKSRSETVQKMCHDILYSDQTTNILYSISLNNHRPLRRRTVTIGRQLSTCMELESVLF
jgi:hypothetical protein